MERRKHKRYSVDNVQGTVVLKSDARVVNMSVAGMTLETNHGLRMGRPLSVTMGDSARAMRITGTIVRCQMVGTRIVSAGEVEPVFRAGLHLEGMLTDRAEELLGFMRDHARIEVERRVFGRFKLYEGQSVTVESEHPFQVVTLSLSGMRVESKRAPDPGGRVEVDLDLHGSVVHAGARVVAVDSAPVAENEPPAQLIDLEFAAMADSERSTLEEFIRRELETGEAAAQDAFSAPAEP